MNEIVRPSLDGEIISPRDMVSVYGTTHPLNAVAGARVQCRVRAGTSIMEILLEALSHKPGHVLRGDLIVRIGDHEIPQENWSRVRVKPGAVVTFSPRLSGGNNTLLRGVLAIVIAVAATAIAGPAGSAFAASAIGTSIGISASVASALIAGGIMLASSLALNALFPVRPISPVGPAGSLNSIQGARNQANPFGPIPVVLGRHRQSPYLAAKQYTEIVGDDQYLRALFCLGYGPLSIEDLKIGETPLASFEGVQTQVLEGFDDDDPVTLYPKQVDEVSLSIELDAPPHWAFGVNPGDWHTQTTSAETDQISIDVTAVEGIFSTDKDGDEIYSAVNVNAEYRAVGSVGSWTTIPTMTFSRSLAPTRRGSVVNVTRGQYDVRARRETGRGNPQFAKDKIVWTALRSIRNETPIDFPKPLALIAVRIKATDQLSGSIDTLNCITTSKVKAFSGTPSVWNDATTSQNPADLFRHVLQGPANARPEPDSRIDVGNLEDWWAYCLAKGFTFNQVITSVGSVYDKLCDIAAAGRAVPTFIDGKWGVIWDRPDDPIVQVFTPRNSWGFQGQKPYAQQPHGWRVSFIDESNGFTADERIVYDDGYDETNATLFEGLEFPGVTDPGLIWKHGRFHIAQSRLRPEKISLSVGWEHLVCTRGDRVEVQHDVALIGLASGRVKAVAGQVVTLDEEVTIEDGKTYGLRFRVPGDQRIVSRAVDATAAGDYTSLTLVGDLSDVTSGLLFAFGETDRETAVYRVQGIAHQSDLVATLTLVDDAPEISLADQGEIPAYTPNVTIPADPFTLPPRDLRYLELIDGRGATARALVRLSWQVPRFGNIASFQAQLQDVDNGDVWVTAGTVVPPATSIDVPISRAGVFSFRVRCIFSNGTVSAWATLSNLNLAALSTPPADVTNLHIRSVDGQTVLDWTIVDDQRSINYEIRKGSSWDTGLVVGDAVAQPPWASTGDGTYHVRAYVLSPFNVRIYSENTASITVVDSIISRNIIISRDEQADGWPSGLDGGVIDGSFIRTDGSTPIATPWAQEVIDQLALAGVDITIYISSEIVDIGRAAECRFWTEYEASGVLQVADFLGQTDVLSSGDILGTSPTRFIRAFPIWRFASEGDNDVFAPTDVFNPPDVFAADIDWGDWVAIASGTRVSRYFQSGFVLITDREDTDATGTKFRWFVDVPDRTDDYTELAVPDTGLSVTFYTGGYDGTATPGATATPFNGGPNGADVPHVQRAIVNGTDGDEVKITNLTLAGCTVNVVNAGVNVTRSGVNLLVRGY